MFISMFWLICAVCCEAFLWSWLNFNAIEPKGSGGNDDTHWYESTLVFKIEYEYRVFTARESKKIKGFLGGYNGVHINLSSLTK